MSSFNIRAYKRREAELDGAASRRRFRIIDSIIGKDRQFGGTIIINGATAITSESKAFVLYSDGSVKFNGWGFNDVLGAGIAWQDDDDVEEGEIVEDWHTDSFALGVNTGDVVDTELFAVAAALRVAVERVEHGGDVKLVRVYTDCMRMLETIQRDTIIHLGPARDKIWALQNVYDRVDWLEAEGTKVELVWVKGHAGNQGNGLADKAATEEVWKQIREMGKVEEKRKMTRKRDVPAEIKLAGDDAVEEWYWRVNKALLLKGEVEEEEDANMSDGSSRMDISDSDS